MAEIPRLALNYAEAAESVGYSRDVLKDAVANHELIPSYGTKSKPVFRITELQRWLDARPAERGSE